MSRYIAVKAGTRAAKCKRCPATIFFAELPHRPGKMHPVDCTPSNAAPASRAPTSSEDGMGVSHFATCPEAESFRKAER